MNNPMLVPGSRRQQEQRELLDDDDLEWNNRAGHSLSLSRSERRRVLRTNGETAFMVSTEAYFDEPKPELLAELFRSCARDERCGTEPVITNVNVPLGPHYTVSPLVCTLAHRYGPRACSSAP